MKAVSVVIQSGFSLDYLSNVLTFKHGLCHKAKTNRHFFSLTPSVCNLILFIDTLL